MSVNFLDNQATNLVLQIFKTGQTIFKGGGGAIVFRLSGNIIPTKISMYTV